MVMEKTEPIEDFIRFIEVTGIRGEKESYAVDYVYRVQSLPGFGTQVFVKDFSPFITRDSYEDVLKKINDAQEHNLAVGRKYQKENK